MKIANNNRTYLGITLIIILVLGLLQISLPFFGDQAFYLLGAKEMNNGLVLYRDFWDIKQPGIFFFYLIGGKIFGFNYIGIHLFELTYWLIFCFILIWFLKKYIYKLNQIWAYFSTIVLVGTYYACSYPSVLTQVEALVNFPLMLVLIFNTLYLREIKRKWLWILLSGIAGGIVVFFKLILAPILVVLWLITFLRSVKINNLYTSILFFLLIPVGILFAWIPFLGYCWHHNIFQLCFNTFFEYPPLIISYCQRMSFEHLFNSMTNYFLKLILILPFTLLSLSYLRKNEFIQNLFLWLLVAFGVVLIQKTSWYSWHFYLLNPPIILLAIFSLQKFLERALLRWTFLLRYNTYIVIFTLLLFINLPAIGSLSIKVLQLSKYNFGLTSVDRRNYALTNQDNARAFRISKSLEKETDKSCPIFVVNDPLVYYYTNRTQAIAQSGWSMHLFIPGQLEELFEELVKNKPCYIFIRKPYDYYFENEGRQILKWIQKNYTILDKNLDGTWFALISTIIPVED